MKGLYLYPTRQPVRALLACCSLANLFALGRAGSTLIHSPRQDLLMPRSSAANSLRGSRLQQLQDPSAVRGPRERSRAATGGSAERSP